MKVTELLIYLCVVIATLFPRHIYGYPLKRSSESINELDGKHEKSYYTKNAETEHKQQEIPQQMSVSQMSVDEDLNGPEQALPAVVIVTTISLTSSSTAVRRKFVRKPLMGEELVRRPLTEDKHVRSPPTNGEAVSGIFKSPQTKEAFLTSTIGKRIQHSILYKRLYGAYDLLELPTEEKQRDEVTKPFPSQPKEHKSPAFSTITFQPTAGSSVSDHIAVSALVVLSFTVFMIFFSICSSLLKCPYCLYLHKVLNRKADSFKSNKMTSKRKQRTTAVETGFLKQRTPRESKKSLKPVSSKITPMIRKEMNRRKAEGIEIAAGFWKDQVESLIVSRKSEYMKSVGGSAVVMDSESSTINMDNSTTPIQPAMDDSIKPKSTRRRRRRARRRRSAVEESYSSGTRPRRLSSESKPVSRPPMFFSLPASASASEMTAKWLGVEQPTKQHNVNLKQATVSSTRTESCAPPTSQYTQMLKSMQERRKSLFLSGSPSMNQFIAEIEEAMHRNRVTTVMDDSIQQQDVPETSVRPSLKKPDTQPEVDQQRNESVTTQVRASPTEMSQLVGPGRKSK